MNKLLIFDIDGVVCDSSVRLSKYSDESALVRGDYNAFRASMHAYGLASVEDDVPIAPGIDLFHSLRNFYNPERVIFLTSRGGVGRVNTLKWLRDYVVPDFSGEDLIMRPVDIEYEPGVFWREGDMKFSATDFKRWEVLRLLGDYDVMMAVDDHLPICEMYESLGINALHVKFPGIDCITGSGMSIPAVS